MQLRLLSRTFRLLLCTVALVSSLAAQPKIDSLAFLAGQWRGTNNEGQPADEIYALEGGLIVGFGREFDKAGKCVFYDLEVFAETPTGLVFKPHPMGKPAGFDFPLVVAESGPNKAVFVNEKNSFPKRFVWELVGPDELRITLSGERKSQPYTEVFQLKRVGTTKR